MANNQQKSFYFTMMAMVPASLYYHTNLKIMTTYDIRFSDIKTRTELANTLDVNVKAVQLGTLYNMHDRWLLVVISMRRK